MATSQTFRALDYYEAHESPVASAEALADAVVPAVARGESVRITFEGLRGISSSYFNALLIRLRAAASGLEVRRRVTFVTDSNAQKEILDRSINAVLGLAA